MTADIQAAGAPADPAPADVARSGVAPPAPAPPASVAPEAGAGWMRLLYVHVVFVSLLAAGVVVVWFILLEAVTALLWDGVVRRRTTPGRSR